ncbi:hypothetical protein [uncultured Chryseobacterium sp.]|uniref:hypothetical protein n=1 Tax=uncultured Chryseobacterium sp. TaxID=259322 RepID=UPI0025F5549B|nr:hypothetical protein [uncultured Chryseobacterium sp.]
MSFKITNLQNETIDFENLTLNVDEKIFQLQASNNFVNVRYEPKIFDSAFEGKKMAYYFFQNAYLNAENNIFQVYHEKTRIGWVFPIQALVSNENDFAENIYFSQYKYSTYKEILSGGIATKKININSQDSYSLIDFFEDDIIIFCVSLEKLEENNMEISDFLPSFSKYGYYIYEQGDNTILRDNDKANFFLKHTKTQKLLITKSKVKLSDHTFLQNLYYNYLKKIDDKVLRFFMLYQVIEYFLDKDFNYKFDKILKNYEEKKIDKNTFRERINKSSNERSLINNLTAFINDDDLTVDFKRDGKLFLENFGEYDKNEVGDIIYDIRNLLIHRYRDIDTLDTEKIKIFQIITNQLEQIINSYMINYYR